MEVKEYELDGERNNIKQKTFLPESGKRGLFLLPSLSRHIIIIQMESI